MEMKEIVMKHKIAIVPGLVLIAIISSGVLYSQPKSQSSPGQQDKIAALKNLRDSGVVTEQEYDAKVKTFQVSIPAASASAHAAKISWSSTRKAEIIDPQYQITAYTLEVPTGWKYAGAIARDPWCHSVGGDLKYTMQSPDGLTAMARIPGVRWSWSSSASFRENMESVHCPAIDIDSAAGFLVNIAIPNLHPNAKIVAVLPLLPEGQASLAEQLEKARQQNAAMARQYGQQPQKLTLDGARVRVQYERDGQPVEEMIVSVVDCFESQMPALYKQPAYEQRGCSSRGTIITRAPQGRLDELMALPQFKSFGKSIQINPEWNNRISRDRQANFEMIQAESKRRFEEILAQGRKDHDALMERGRAGQQTTRESTDRALASDRARQDAMHQSAIATAKASLDRQDFRDPNTGQTIEASSQYYHQWISSDGSTLIQTNDHSLDPNGQVYPVSQSWTELIPK